MIRKALIFVLLSSPALAQEIVTCPDPVTLTQVGSCASMQELKWGYTGYCSDNARMYDKDSTTCTSFEEYRKKKDLALWEAGDFHAYLPCGQDVGAWSGAKPGRMTLAQDGAVTRLVCAYDGGLTLTLRTKKACTLDQGQARCADGGS